MDVTARDFVAIGIVEKAHGIKGKVRVKPITDYPPRFKLLESVIIENRSGESRRLAVSEISVGDRVVYLRLESIETREEAEQLRGTYLGIRRDEVLTLEDDRFYHFEIIGFNVITVSGREIGYVEEVMDLTANAVLVVRNVGCESLIPVIKDVIKEIDKDNRKILIDPINGLID